MAGNKSRKRVNKRIIAAAAAAALVVCGVAYGNNVARNREREQATKNLVQLQVSRGDISKTVVGTGTVNSGDAKDVRAPQGVEVEKVYVEEGDSVKKGEKIASVSEVSVKEQLLSIEEAIDSKNDEIDDLDKDDDHYKLKKEIAKAELKDLKESKKSMKKLGETCVIKANASGIISQLSLEEGEEVSGISAGTDSSGLGGSGLDADTLKAYLNVSDAGSDSPDAYINGINRFAQGNTDGSDSPAADADNAKKAENPEQTGGAQTAGSNITAAGGADSSSSGSNSLNGDSSNGGSNGDSSGGGASQTRSGADAGDQNTSGSDASDGSVQGSDQGGSSSQTGSNQGSGSSQTGSDQGSGSSQTGSDQGSGSSQTGSDSTSASGILNETPQNSAGIGTDADPSKKAPEAVNFDSINLSVKAPAAGEAPQTSVEIADGLHMTPLIIWVPSADKFTENSICTAVIILRAESGYYIAGDGNGKINVKIDSCPDAVSASYDTDNDGYIDTVIAVCPYSISSANASDAQITYLQQLAQKQAMQLLSQFSQNYPQLREQIQSRIQGINKKLKKSAKSLSKDLRKSLNGLDISSLLGNMDLSSLLGDAGTDLSSLLGNSGTDLSSLTGSSGSSYDDSKVTVAQIVPVKTAFVDIDVDELDINQLQVGQTADVTLDALEDQDFSGEITKVSQLTDSDSGKYTVRIKIEKTDDIKFGMSATATVDIDKRENVLYVPVEAIQTLDGNDVVYTGADDEGNLTDPVQITTGLSDGDNAAVVSGLNEGQTIYYFKTETNYSVVNNFESEAEQQRQ